MFRLEKKFPFTENYNKRIYKLMYNNCVHTCNKWTKYRYESSIYTREREREREMFIETAKFIRLSFLFDIQFDEILRENIDETFVNIVESDHDRNRNEEIFSSSD